MKTKSPSIMAALQACPAHESTVTRELFLECWDELRREDVTPFSQPEVPVMAALVLHHDGFARLLSQAELERLRSLVQAARERYAQQTNPPNKLGRLLAGLIKKEST